MKERQKCKCKKCKNENQTENRVSVLQLTAVTFYFFFCTVKRSSISYQFWSVVPEFGRVSAETDSG